jgi:predicted ArsR family transcriptional regulator
MSRHMALRQGHLQLTLNTRLVIESLHRAQHPMYAYNLARSLHFPDQAVQGIFHRLETAGYARQVDAPPDAPPQDHGRNRRWFELTPEGKAFAADIQPETQEILADQARTIGMSLEPRGL